jgi:hemolysin activation/secretion protein
VDQALRQCRLSLNIFWPRAGIAGSLAMASKLLTRLHLSREGLSILRSSLRAHRRGLRLARALAAALLLVGSGVAAAQTTNIPGSVEPGRLQQQFQPPPAPAPTPEVVSPEVPEAVPPAEAARIRFTLRQIIVDGATVYQPQQLEELYAGFLDQDVSLADIYRIADIITTKYRSDGYILSRAVVPAQRISNGVVHITVVEGFINRVIIQGEDSVALQSYADQLTQSRPLTADNLQRYLLLMNDLPGVQARGVLAPATGVSGGSDLTVVVESKRMDASVSLDNHGSKFVGPIQLFSEAAVNNPTGRSDRLGARYITTPVVEEELRYLEMNYGIALGSEGMKLFVSASGTESMPGSTLQTVALRTESSGQTVTGRLSYPIIRSRAENLSADVSFTLRNSVLVQFALPSQTRLVSSYEDHVRVLRAGLNYDTTDRYEGRDFVRFELSRGLPLFDATSGGQSTGTSRPGAQAQFWKATLDASRLQSLNALQPGLGLLTAASAGGSFGQQLFASEQFGVGGTQFGRGYDPSEITGDYGASAKAELQYNFGLPIAQERPAFQAYTFYDYGLVADASARAVGQPAGPRTLTSLGLGLRASLQNRLLADLELAQPISRTVSAYSDSTNHKPLRAYFSLIATF